MVLVEVAARLGVIAVVAQVEDHGGGIDLAAGLLGARAELCRLVVGVQSRTQIDPLWGGRVGRRGEGREQARQLLWRERFAHSGEQNDGAERGRDGVVARWHAGRFGVVGLRW